MTAEITANQDHDQDSNSPFSPVLPTLQLYIDATSLTALKTCPEYYNNRIRLGYVTQARATNPDLFWGGEFHAACELYDHLRVQGLSHDKAVLKTVKHLFIRTWDFETNRPWVSEKPAKTRYTLIRAVVWYLEQFKDDPLETIILHNGKPAVELSFRFSTEIKTISTNETFIACGHLDRCVKFHGKIYITDKKTSSFELDDKFFALFNPDVQMGLYAIAGAIVFDTEIDGLIIDGVQCLVTGNRYRREFIQLTQAQREQYLEDLRFWLQVLEHLALNEYKNPNKPWPKNETQCFKYNRLCEFHRVCSEDPAHRMRLLETYYTKQPWNPREVR